MQKTVFLIALVLTFVNSVCFADVVFEGVAKQSVEGMKVYKMDLQPMTEDKRMNRIQEVLGSVGHKVAGESKLTKTDRFVGVQSDNLESLINVYGSEIIFTNLPALKLTEKVRALPKDEEAVMIARDFLKTARLVDLERGELVLDHVGGLMQALASPRYNFTPEKKAVAVYFNRMLDGYPVKNKGSHITVMIGDNFAPINMQYNWREISEAVKDVSKSETIPLDKLKDSILKDIWLIHDINQHIIVDRVYPVYYDRGEKYIQPAYCYEGRVIDKREEHPILGFVPALADPPEPVHHPAYVEEIALPKETKSVARTSYTPTVTLKGSTGYGVVYKP